MYFRHFRASVFINPLSVCLFVCWNKTRKAVLHLLCWEGSKPPWESSHTGRGTNNVRTKDSGTYHVLVNDDDGFYYHSWRNNLVIAFGTLTSFLT